METESLAKIAIRGKGSVKEGKGRSDAAHASNQEEDLHCLIMADTEEKVNKAKKLIHNVIETVRSPLSPEARRILLTIYGKQAASIPEGQNELKRNQLRELAALNGTLRDDENQACQNCRFPLSTYLIRTVLTSQVVKSVIVNMTALSSATSPPTLSVVSVVTLVTWLVTVLTAREAATGATMASAAVVLELLVLVMPSTGRWSNSCTNSPVAPLVKRRLAVLKPVLAKAMMTMT